MLLQMIWFFEIIVEMIVTATDSQSYLLKQRFFVFRQSDVHSVKKGVIFKR